MSKASTAVIAAIISLVSIAAFYVLREHWGHGLGMLPYVLLLACPLLHLFVHGSSGKVGQAEQTKNEATRIASERQRPP